MMLLLIPLPSLPLDCSPAFCKASLSFIYMLTHVLFLLHAPSPSTTCFFTPHHEFMMKALSPCCPHSGCSDKYPSCFIYLSAHTSLCSRPPALQQHASSSSHHQIPHVFHVPINPVSLISTSLSFLHL
jgi:hypothetical protein